MGTSIIQAQETSTGQPGTPLMTDGALHTLAAIPEGGTLVKQGEGDEANPWFVRGPGGESGLDLASEATLGEVKTAVELIAADFATETTLEELTAQGRSANAITLANLVVTGAPVNFPSILLSNGAYLSVKNPDGSGETVYIGRGNGIAAALNIAQPTWPIPPGDGDDFGGANANEWWICATGSCTIAYRVEARS